MSQEPPYHSSSLPLDEDQDQEQSIAQSLRSLSLHKTPSHEYDSLTARANQGRGGIPPSPGPDLSRKLPSQTTYYRDKQMLLTNHHASSGTILEFSSIHHDAPSRVQGGGNGTTIHTNGHSTANPSAGDIGMNPRLSQLQLHEPSPRPGFLSDFSQGMMTPRLQKHFSYQGDTDTTESGINQDFHFHHDPQDPHISALGTPYKGGDGTTIGTSWSNPALQQESQAGQGTGQSHRRQLSYQYDHSMSELNPDAMVQSTTSSPSPPPEGPSPSAHDDINDGGADRSDNYESDNEDDSTPYESELDIPDVKSQFLHILQQTHSLASTLEGSIKRSFDCTNILNEISTKQLEHIESTVETLRDEITFTKNIFITLQIKAFQLQQLLLHLPEMVHEIDSIMQMLPALEARVEYVVKNIKAGKMKFVPPPATSVVDETRNGQGDGAGDAHDDEKSGVDLNSTKHIST